MDSDRRGPCEEIAFSPPHRGHAIGQRVPATGRSEALIGAEGQWCNARVSVLVPSTWDAVTFELYARFGSTEILVQRATVVQAGFRVVSNKRASLVLSVDGMPCDGFNVYAIPDGTTRTEAELTLFCWGDDTRPGDVVTGENTAHTASNLVVVTERARLVAAWGINGAGATQFLMVFDAAALPANGTVPRWAPLPVLTGALWSMAPPRVPFQTGIVLAMSTSRATLAIAAANNDFTGFYTRP